MRGGQPSSEFYEELIEHFPPADGISASELRRWSIFYHVIGECFPSGPGEYHLVGIGHYDAVGFFVLPPQPRILGLGECVQIQTPGYAKAEEERRERDEEKARKLADEKVRQAEDALERVMRDLSVLSDKEWAARVETASQRGEGSRREVNQHNRTMVEGYLREMARRLTQNGVEIRSFRKIMCKLNFDNDTGKIIGFTGKGDGLYNPHIPYLSDQKKVNLAQLSYDPHTGRVTIKGISMINGLDALRMMSRPGGWPIHEFDSFVVNVGQDG